MVTKRERAVWKDDEEALITEVKSKQVKTYGRKPLSQDYSENLRMEFQYVYSMQASYIMFLERPMELKNGQ